MQKQPESVAQPLFSELGISEKILTTLTKINFINPTPIQHQVIPVALKGQDIVGIAQTGTGKTLAFGIPLLQRLGKEGGQGLILLPTRELAAQVNEEINKIGRPLGLRTAILIGGVAQRPQISQLRNKPHIVIATPGRLVDHMNQGNWSLSKVSIIVLDEADRMLDIGFAKEITTILDNAPKDKQTMLFSATMPKAITALAVKYMKTPLRVEVAPQGTSPKDVEQEVFIIPKSEKFRLLELVLEENEGSVILFSRTKHGAKKIAKFIRDLGHTATEIHSNRSQNQRKMALDGFRKGTFRVLVATDIAARGIDVEHIKLVINFDLPEQSEDYVHRIGRTGRAGRTGKAISFAAPDQRHNVRQIERLIRQSLNLQDTPQLPPPRKKSEPTDMEDRPREGGRGRGRNREGGRSRDRGGSQRGRGIGTSQNSAPTGQRQRSGGKDTRQEAVGSTSSDRSNPGKKRGHNRYGNTQSGLSKSGKRWRAR